MSDYHHMQDPCFRRLRNIVLAECIKEIDSISLRDSSFEGSRSRLSCLKDVCDKLRSMIYIEEIEEE